MNIFNATTTFGSRQDEDKVRDLADRLEGRFDGVSDKGAFFKFFKQSARDTFIRLVNRDCTTCRADEI